MGFFNKFKKEKLEEKNLSKAPKLSLEAKKTEVKPVKEQKLKEPSAGKSGIFKGKTSQSYKIIVKPLVTEKASSLGSLGKYVFAVSSKTNKVEIKKAIRTIYNVDPIKINILNFSGRSVRYGRTAGKTKNWKKAVVTLKPGDKIEIYEGV